MGRRAGSIWSSNRSDQARAHPQGANAGNLQPRETLYDLGAGDGRVLVIAAREFGARAVGIEIGLLQCLVAWLAALFNGVRQEVRIEQGDFFKADLRPADVVFAYLTSAQAERLQGRLAFQLRPGARVVTISFDLPGWAAASFDNEHLIFLYRISNANNQRLAKIDET